MAEQGNLLIDALRLSNFRNYNSYTLDNIGSLTVLIGRNGVGKTNLLEALYLLTTGSSFRNSQIAQLIREGSDNSLIEMEYGDGNRLLSTSLALEEGKKRFRVNGKAKSVSEIRGSLPAVAFVPDDLELAKKSSGVKRNTLDALGVQLSKNYGVIHRDFEKTLRYKNRLLKEESSHLLVEAINETLLTCASELFSYRYALFNRIVPLASELYRSITHTEEVFSARYTPSWERFPGNGFPQGERAESGRDYDRKEVRELMGQAMDRNATEERSRKRALIGPHGDEITFTLSGKDASQFASQGQQRSIVLAWKMAEVEMTKKTLGVNPVLLLDDVMSELDENRRNLLVATVGDSVQTFVTSTDLSPFNDDILERARIVELS